MRLDGQYNRNVNVCCKKNIKDKNLSFFVSISHSFLRQMRRRAALFFGGPIS
jgi:hypothetical protein